MNEWHNKGTILFCASTECCPTRSGRRGFPQIYEEGERRCGRDALSNTSSECVVAKANEADCFANTEVQTPEEGGRFDFVLNNKIKIIYILNFYKKTAKRFTTL